MKLFEITKDVYADKGRGYYLGWRWYERRAEGESEDYRNGSYSASFERDTGFWQFECLGHGRDAFPG
ncbi:MAG: hypothetical protein ACUVWO_04175 [Thermodesulfobacteriota bacterium]